MRIKATIIGGKGQMGRWLGRFFERHKCDVMLIGRNDDPKKAVSDADILVISVPKEATCDVIREVGPLIKESSLLMDVTSIKEKPIEAMLKYSKAEVVGTHPVFGPYVSTFRNQTMVICPGRGEKWREWLIKMLLKEGAKLKISTAADHDKMMSVIQSVTHFSSITLSHVWERMGVNVMQGEEYSSPTYRLNMDVIGRLLYQNPYLYAQICINNEYSLKAIKAYLEECTKLYSIIKDKNIEEFATYFKHGSDYFQEFNKEAFEYTNYLIETLAKRRVKKK